MVAAADDYVRLDSILLQLFDRVLRRLRLQFLGSAQVWDECQMDRDYVVVRKLPVELALGFNERQGFNVPHRASDLRQNHIVLSGLS